MLTIILIALATASMTLTISRSKAFSWFRNSFIGNAKIRELVRCHYCLGHWVALWWLLISPSVRVMAVTTSGPVYNFLVNWFAVVAIASFMMGLILLVVPMRGDDVPQKEIE